MGKEASRSFFFHLPTTHSDIKHYGTPFVQLLFICMLIFLVLLLRHVCSYKIHAHTVETILSCHGKDLINLISNSHDQIL